MGRFRTITLNNPNYTYNELYNKKNGLEMLKTIRNTECISKYTDNYLINDQTAAFSNYKNYNIFYNIANAYGEINILNNNCESIPRTLGEGVKTEVTYDEIANIHYDTNNCKELIYNYNNCLPNGILYPYGRYNNNIMNQNIFIHGKISPYICGKLECKQYEYCKCQNIHNNTKCCSYKYFYPSANGNLNNVDVINNTLHSSLLQSDNINSINASTNSYAIIPNIKDKENIIIYNNIKQHQNKKNLYVKP